MSKNSFTRMQHNYPVGKFYVGKMHIHLFGNLAYRICLMRSRPYTFCRVVVINVMYGVQAVRMRFTPEISAEGYVIACSIEIFRMKRAYDYIALFYMS